MKSKTSTGLVQHYIKAMTGYSQKFKKHLHKKDIHDFRVNVKKLRAFLRMMRLKSEQPGELKYSHSFKEMYATTGKIRDRQLFLQRIKAIDKALATVRAKDVKKEIEELRKSGDEFPGRKDMKEMETRITKCLP